MSLKKKYKIKEELEKIEKSYICKKLTPGDCV
jgi:hypothetical protein